MSLIMSPMPSERICQLSVQFKYHWLIKRTKWFRDPFRQKNMKRQHLPKRKNRGETKRTFDTKSATGIFGHNYANVDFYIFKHNMLMLLHHFSSPASFLITG